MNFQAGDKIVIRGGSETGRACPRRAGLEAAAINSDIPAA
jgi:hypothetical protein